ncbi:MAG: hypothetical protein KAW12_23945 [Candidatus Aminicenantes bacterium]|nr:hypothetical protein [Candidatus Aminicenantes bacterium]
MSLAEPIQVTQRVVQEFERLDIRYFVGGSLASSLHGIPRATQDVDIVAEIKTGHIPKLVDALEKEFYIDADMIKDAIQTRMSFNIIHLATMFKVDIFVLKNDMASQEEMERRKHYQISDAPDQMLFLASAEDIILHKLYWFQLGGGVSERQWNDVLGVIKIQSEILDVPYLESAAKKRGVDELLRKAFKDAEK